MAKALLIRVNGNVKDGIKTVLEASQQPVSTEVLAFLLAKPTYKDRSGPCKVRKVGESEKSYLF